MSTISQANGDERLHAVLLCGGKGTRLSSLTNGKPKPLYTVGGRPLISYAVDLLDPSLISHITFASGRNTEQIREWVGSTNITQTVSYQTDPDFGIPSRVVHAASITNSEHMIVMNADIVFDRFPLRPAIDQHRQSDSKFTLLVTETTDAHGNGPNGLVVRSDRYGGVVMAKRSEVGEAVTASSGWMEDVGMALLRRDAVHKMGLAEEKEDWWGILGPVFDAGELRLHKVRTTYFNVNSPPEATQSSAHVNGVLRP